MKKSLLLAVASLAVISCSKREIGTVDPNAPADNQVRFSSTTGEVASKVGVDANGHSTFETGDIIGVYAVNHGKKLGEIPGVTTGTTEGVFPNNSSLQYLNKKYKVVTVDPYNTGTSSAALAAFEANTKTGTPNDLIYYQSGGKGWNYYAYFPTSDLTEASDFATMNSVAQTTTFSITNTLLTFMNQVNVKGNDIESGQTVVAYPGPIMFAYYNTENKAPSAGVSNTPVKLDFKYANAKLTANFEMKGNAGVVGDVKSVILYGTGMKQGFVFDLAKAKGIYEQPTPVNNVLVTNATAGVLDGSGINNGMVIGGSTKAYVFGKKVTLKASDKNAADHNGATVPGASDPGYKDSTLCTTTGYLIPCPAVTNAKLEVRVGDYPDQQIFTAKLDETEGGTVTNVTDATTGQSRVAVNHLLKIEPGKEYKFNIVISRKNVNFTGTIEDWTVVQAPNTIPAE